MHDDTDDVHAAPDDDRSSHEADSDDEAKYELEYENAVARLHRTAKCDYAGNDFSTLLQDVPDLDIDTPDPDGYTAVMLAAMRGHSDTTWQLLDLGVNVNAVHAASGQTALLFAASAGHAETVRILLSGDANVRIADARGYTALHAAAVGGHFDVVAIICEGYSAHIKDAVDAEGETALHKAVYERCRDSAGALLNVGVNPNIKNIAGETAVWHAAHSNSARMLRLLVQGGGNVNEPNSDGITPLIALVLWGFLALQRDDDVAGDAHARLQILLAHPDLDISATFEGKTAHQWALQLGLLTAASVIEAEVW